MVWTVLALCGSGLFAAGLIGALFYYTNTTTVTADPAVPDEDIDMEEVDEVEVPAENPPERVPVSKPIEEVPPVTIQKNQ